MDLTEKVPHTHHLIMKTDPDSETLCSFILCRTPGDGKDQTLSNPERYMPSSEAKCIYGLHTITGIKQGRLPSTAFIDCVPSFRLNACSMRQEINF
jgi:hypothetical protein